MAEASAASLLADVTADVTADLGALFDALDEIADRTTTVFAARSVATADGLSTLDPLLVSTLTEHGELAAGLGLVLDPASVVGRPRWLQWFWHTPGRMPERLRAQLDPLAADFYDYTTTEWYRAPLATGHRAVVGPYVDYICSNEYVFTLAVPITVGGRGAGIAGADVRVSRIEQLLLPRLRELGGDIVLSNGAGRVITSTVAALPSGSLITGKGTPLTPGLPWVLHEGTG